MDTKYLTGLRSEYLVRLTSAHTPGQALAHPGAAKQLVLHFGDVIWHCADLIPLPALATTMWIGSNPDYITLEPVTTTTNNAPVTTTRTVRIDVAPPTSPVDGPKIASIGVTLSHSALKDLENLAGRLCGSGKRQTCALRQDELATGLLRYIEGTLHVFNAQKLATNLEIGVTVIAGGIALATAKEYIQTGRISRPNFGLNSGSLKQRYTSASSTTSSVATTVLDDNPDSPFTDTDHAYKSVAQEVIAMISREASDGPMFGPRATEAWCLHGAAPNHAREPKEYCACGDKHATYYSVAKSTSSPYIPCPYVKLSQPEKLIHLYHHVLLMLISTPLLAIPNHQVPRLRSRPL